MEAYFPQEMLNELGQLNNNAEPGPATIPNAAAIAGTAADSGDPANPGDAQQASATQEETRFDIVHSIQYNPWTPTPADVRFESNVVGTCATLREANMLAMKEVYEKYGGLAHIGRGIMNPPNPDWLRRGEPEAGRWPNTWKIMDGQLSFAVVNSKLEYTLRGQITVVKR